jgi:hypothetical protein
VVVVAAGVAKLVGLQTPEYFNHISDVAGAAGFYIGIPLLAALPFGEEFQLRTLSFLVSQPIDRMKIWTEKWIVLTVAVFSAALVYWLAWQGSLRYGFFVAAALWAIVSVCSGTFWILFARSTIGGMVLSSVPLIVGSIALNLLQWLFGMNLFPSSKTSINIGIAAVLSYAALMLWLGRRRFARLETTDGVAAVDLVVGGRNPISETLAGFLRCRPIGAIRNLIRKELRILWPVWMLTILALVFVLCLAPYRSEMMVHEPVRFSTAAVVTVLMLGLYSALASILAGSLVMGEERLWGTHLAQLTLPISANVQWLVKLCVAVLSSTVCVYAVITLAFALLGQPFSAAYHDLFVGLINPYYVPLIWTFAAFWCACAIKGTVRASLWVIPAVVAVLAPFGMGLFTLRVLLGFFYIQSIVHPYPFDNRAFDILEKFMRGQYAALWLLVPVLLVALWESLKLFRRDVGHGVRPFLRSLVLPAVVAYATAFVPEAPRALAISNQFQTRDVLIEVARAVEQMRIDPAKLSADKPLQFTFKDLNGVSPVSVRGRRWLQDASIGVVGKRVPIRVWKGRHFEIE